MDGRRTRLGAALAVTLATTIAGPVAWAAPDPGPARPDASGSETVRRDARGHLRAEVDLGGLGGPSANAPDAVVRAWVGTHLRDLGITKAQAAGLYVLRTQRLGGGGTAVHLGQRIAGLRVEDAVLTGVVAPDGRLLGVSGSLAAGPGRRPAVRLDARSALDVAARRSDATAARRLTEAAVTTPGRRTFPNVYATGLRSPHPLSAELVWVVRPDGGLRQAWLTDVESSPTDWFETAVDAASGAVLTRSSRYAHLGPEGNVIREQHPGVTGAAQQVTAFTGLDGSWVTDRATSGNNVNAYQDRDEDNASDYQPQTPASGDPQYQHFDYPFTDAWRNQADVDNAAALDTDRDPTITQLFYYANVMHDWLYGYGFDEASGNFQVDNFGRGGSGGDPVLAEAQDGWDFGCVDDQNTPNPGDDVDVRCLNNANFGTPADGSSPRMQMYLWAPGRPYRDGSMDGDVIAHEYGHGVSSRLVGGGNLGYANNQSGALGEGWSDTISMLKWGDSTVGEYVTGNASTGIRSVDYATSTRGYGSYQPGQDSPHSNGEIWASTMYDVRELLGLDAATQLVLDGMKSTTATPDFLDARDGILMADAASGTPHTCELWGIFAARGMGTNAASSALDGPVTANSDLPASCLPTADAGGPYSTPEGTDVTLDGTGSTANAGTVTEYAWDLDDDGSYDDATGPTPAFTTVGRDGVRTVGLRVTNSVGGQDTDSTTVTVTNVAPTVAIDPIAPVDELGTVTVTGVVRDPGWLDPLSATVSFDDGAGPAALTGVEEHTRPDGTITFSVEHQYGDDGAFTVEVCAADDDTSGNCSSAVATVANVDPSVTIDESGAQTYGGTTAFVLRAGEELTVPVHATDPGSDDLTATWQWGDGTSTDETSLVDPPATDPAKSPTVQPRDVTLESAHTYTDACAYTLDVAVADDDGGLGADSAAVLVTGTATKSRNFGWWLGQYREKNDAAFTTAQLQCYLDITGALSTVFDEVTDASTIDRATVVLHDPAKNDPRTQFDQVALAAWLNLANGAVALDTPVSVGGPGPDPTFAQVMAAAEAVRANPASTDAQVRAQKTVLAKIVTDSR